MKNILIVLTCSLLLANCSNRFVLGPKCTSPDKVTGAYEKSIVWRINKTMSNEAFEKRISKENCPKIAKKS